MNSFSVTCPYCDKINQFTDDNWHDEFLDASQDHPTPCLHCGKTMLVIVHLTVRLEAEKYEEDSPCPK